MSEVVYTACRYKSGHLSHYRHIARLINCVSKKKLKENMRTKRYILRKEI